MSYSFNIRAATKAEAKAKVASELDQVVARQPTHERDRKQAQAAADAFIDLLDDDESRDVAVTVNGYVSWVEGEQKVFTSASVGVSVSMSTRPAA